MTRFHIKVKMTLGKELENIIRLMEYKYGKLLSESIQIQKTMILQKKKLNLMKKKIIQMKKKRKKTIKDPKVIKRFRKKMNRMKINNMLNQIKQMTKPKKRKRKRRINYRN